MIPEQKKEQDSATPNEQETSDIQSHVDTNGTENFSKQISNVLHTKDAFTEDENSKETDTSVNKHPGGDKSDGDLVRTGVNDIESNGKSSQHQENEDSEEESSSEDPSEPLTNKAAREDDIPDWMWEQYERETRCGMRECKPDCMQWLASKKTYIVVYGMIGMLNFAITSYYNSTISTVEKRFKIPSRTSGLAVSALEMGGLSFSLVLSYYGSKSHKTRWVACGTFLVALSCFMRFLPHLIYGAGRDAQELTLEYGGADTNLSSVRNWTEEICRDQYLDEEDCSSDEYSYAPSTIMFASFYLMGVGTSMYYTLGLAYLDDNVSKDKAPFVLSVTTCIRMLGPTVGYMFGAFALEIYVDSSAHPTITNEDPQWIGAWWLGWAPLGVLCGSLSVVIALFPRKLPRQALRTMKANVANKVTTVKSTPRSSFTDFKKVLSRIIKNKVLVCNSLSSSLFIFASIGNLTFMAKYMEIQFRQTASSSSFIIGALGLTFTGLGVLVSGSVISKFKPRARYLAAWNVFVEILDIVGFAMYAFLNCAVDDLHGSALPDNSWNLTAACNSHCDCGTNLKYSPVCSADGSTTFYSACYAGCTTLEMINGTKMYGNCSCIGEDSTGWAVEGVCPVNCSTKFAIFLTLRCILTFLDSSGRAGNSILAFRCVDPADKSVSIGFTEALMCALAFIPGPVLFGYLLDSACKIWGKTCGETGNCWLYDGQKLAYLANFTALGCLLLGTVLDTGVWYYVKDLEIYDKKVEKKIEGSESDEICLKEQKK